MIRRRTLLRVLLALAAVAALVAGWALRGPSGPSYPKVWDSRVLDIVHFVEKERGLTFKHPVNVSFLDDKEFVKKVKEPPPTAKDRKDAQEALEELRAVGLVTGKPDLFAAANSLVSSDVVGLYVPKDKTLFVRGTTLTSYVKVTAAHELTHALQDQYFNLDALSDKAPGGDDSAVTALIEGDAVRIEHVYLKQLSHTDQQAYDEAQTKLQQSSESDTADVPQVLKDLLSMPYAFGPVYLDALVAAGGNEEVNRAFRKPPTVDAQILDPDTYPVGWKPASVGHLSLPPGSKAFDEEQPFGQVWLFDVLGSRLGYTQAWGAVQGWQGDVARPYRVAGKTCLAVDVAMADEQGATRLSTALRHWARYGESVNALGRKVSLRACDPGAKAVLQSQPAPPAFAVLSGRAELIDLLMSDSHVSFARSQCLSDTVLQDVGPAAFAQAQESQTPASEARLQSAFAAAVGACQSVG